MCILLKCDKMINNIGTVGDVHKMDKKEQALRAHREWGGKIEVISRAKVENRADLSVAYTPGVAEPCLEIAKDVDLSYTYTRR